MGPFAFATLGFLGYLAVCPFLEAADPNPCLEGWLSHGNNCYKYFPDKKSWEEAEDVCQHHGAHLVSIQSKGECCRVRKFLARFQPDDDVWIGLHNPRKEPGSLSWQWSDGLRFDHSEWDEGQPNNYRNVGEFCAELWKSKAFKRWNDEICSRKNSFVCKYRLEAEEILCE